MRADDHCNRKNNRNSKDKDHFLIPRHHLAHLLITIINPLSRSYYIKWYGNTGTWKAYFIYDINPTRQYWVNGTFREVTRYVMYSVDERVS